MDGLSNLDETYREYSMALNNDLIRFWSSKVTTGHQGSADTHDNAGASNSIFYFFVDSSICYIFKQLHAESDCL